MKRRTARGKSVARKDAVVQLDSGTKRIAMLAVVDGMCHGKGSHRPGRPRYSRDLVYLVRRDIHAVKGEISPLSGHGAAAPDLIQSSRLPCRLM
jgi:hypothetical protein